MARAGHTGRYCLPQRTPNKAAHAEVCGACMQMTTVNSRCQVTDIKRKQVRGTNAANTLTEQAMQTSRCHASRQTAGTPSAKLNQLALPKLPASAACLLKRGTHDVSALLIDSLRPQTNGAPGSIMPPALNRHNDERNMSRLARGVKSICEGRECGESWAFHNAVSRPGDGRA